MIEVISTDHAPKAIGPYSQAIAAGDYVFTAGQIPFHPATMDIVTGTITEQTERVLLNITAILQAADSDLEHVLKTTVFLIDMADFPAMNEVYAKHFGTHRPARSTVAVAGLPRGARVEIDTIALRRR
jgi:2-iminobutanoate/2-iminopropanoate deaminase